MYTTFLATAHACCIPFRICHLPFLSAPVPTIIGLQKLANRLSDSEAAHAKTKEALLTASSERQSLLLAYGQEKRRFSDSQTHAALTDEAVKKTLRTICPFGPDKLELPFVMAVRSQRNLNAFALDPTVPFPVVKSLKCGHKTMQSVHHSAQR